MNKDDTQWVLHKHQLSIAINIWKRSYLVLLKGFKDNLCTADTTTGPQ